MGRLKNDNASRRIRQDEREAEIVEAIINGMVRAVLFNFLAERIAARLAMQLPLKDE